MKFNAYTQRRRQREGGPSISLFPFLAVLICTMGALVPLLFAITRQARLQAAQAAVAKVAARKVEIQSEHETTQWRIEQLRTSRKKTQEQVADARLELGHLEDHARRLREKIPSLEKTVAELDQLGGDDTRQRSEQIEELEKLRAQIEVAKQQVTDAQVEAASRKKSYAIVPYEGPNQTHRRPIYLECRADAVILQPEGIELSESDFEGPLGPGNPLAGALRAVREYLLASHDFDPQREGEPYPLLLVRPEGIAAYYAARTAMKSWATEFGYEFIDADWKLTYQPPDAQLAQVVREVLVSARSRQQRLIAAAPAAYSKKSKATYRAAPTRGGSVRVGGQADDDQDVEDSGYFPRQPSGRIGHGYGSSGTEETEARQEDSPGPTEAERVASLYGNAGGGTSIPGGQVPGGQGGALGNGYGPAIAGGGMGGNVPAQGMPAGAYGVGNGTIGGGNGAIQTGNGAIGGGSGAIGNGGGGSGLGSGTGDMGAGLTGQGTGDRGQRTADSGQRTGDGKQGIADRGQGTADRGQGTGDGKQGIAGRGQGTADSGQRIGDGGQGTGERKSGGPATLPEGYIVGQPPSEQSASDKLSQTTAEQSSENQSNAKRVMPPRPGEWQPHEKPPVLKPVEEKLDEKKNGKHPKSLAAKRGRNWALPDAADGSVPITRPIRVECRSDQLIIVPEAGLSGGKSISLGTRTETSTQAFISAVWEHMGTWGIAGRGMYWRPVLNVYVAAGAEQRFADLDMLLEGSGLKVERK